MIDYSDYEFYVNTYKGNLSESLFTSLIGKASRVIDKYVNREIKEADLIKYEQIKWVACEIVDFINNNNISNNNLSSLSIDGVSKTYKTGSELNEEKSSILSGLPQELTRCL